MRSPTIEELRRQQGRFWHTHFRFGFFVLGAEAVVALFYFVLTPSGSHRSALTAIAAISALAAAISILGVGRVADKPWRTQFSLAWILVAGVLVAVCAGLDGGLDSPLVYLLLLPPVSAATALSTAAVWICGGAGLVEVVLVACIDSDLQLSESRLSLLIALFVGLIVMTIGIARARTRLQDEEVRALQRLHRLARTDPLTGCLNHGAFYQQLQVEIDRALRRGRDLCLVVGDVDLFKSFNDAHGHDAGDEALANVAKVLRATFRSSDYVARIGGDEFAVILPETSLTEADQVAARISDALRQQTDHGVTLSMGMAALDRREPTTARLFRNADAALYRAKANGRDCVQSVDHEPRLLRELTSTTKSTPTGQADQKLLEQQLRQARQEAREAMTLLGTLQDAAPIGLGFVDRDFRIIRINSILATVNGGTVEEHIGRRVPDVVPGLWSQLEPLYLRAVAGEAVSGDEVTGETADDPGRSHYWLTSLYPVRIESEIIGIGLVAVDITDRKELETQQSTLAHQVVAALAAATEARDPYTAGHQERVAAMAVAIAQRLGLPPPMVEEISLAATIHDLGKVTIPNELLAHPGPLSDIAMKLVETHAQAGYDILRQVDFSEPVAELVLHHHERLDGSGYPDHLSGEAVSRGARIIAVADVVDAISSRRPYRAALGVQVALDALRDGAGTLYDSDVVDACTSLLREGRIGLDAAGDIAVTT